MNREEYLSELYARLGPRLPEKELNRVMRYYEEYFDEAGPNKEQELIAELGPPEALASRIVSAGQEERYRRPRRRWSAGKITALICTSPLWVPLLFGLGAAAFGVVVGVGVGGLGVIAGGIFATWTGFTALFTSGIATTLFFSGLGVFLAALGLAMLAGSVALGMVCGKGVAALFRLMFGGRSVAV